jgi:hypothetical protein
MDSSAQSGRLDKSEKSDTKAETVGLGSPIARYFFYVEGVEQKPFPVQIGTQTGAGEGRLVNKRINV